MRNKMREAREQGGDFDWRSMGEEFSKMGEEANTKMEKVYAAVGNDERFVRSSFISAVKALNN